MDYDVVVIGGGAAGLNAALLLGRARRRVAVIDSGAPRNAPAAHLHGFLSRDGTPPTELLEAGRAEVTGYGVELIDDRVTSVDPGFVVQLESGQVLNTRRVLLATGLRDELPDLPGLAERWGRDVLHCPYCHGWEVRDQPLGILGGHPAAAEHALLIRQWSPDLALFSNTVEPSADERARLDARGIRLVEGKVTRPVIEQDQLAGIELADGQVVPLKALFVRSTMMPNTIDLGCELDDAGFVTTDPSGRTSVAGVWAAGNAVDPWAQLITSAAAGAKAAMAINVDLVAADTAAEMPSADRLLGD